MRVATRRLRSVLEFYEPCLDRDKLKPVLRQVCDLADALGQRRDPDVELEALAQFAAAATPSERPGIDRFVAKTSDQQMQANGELSEMLEQIERDDLRGRLRELTEPQPTATEVDSGQGEEDPGQATEAGEPPAKSGWLRRR